MNQKELNELRRRFRLDRSSIGKIFGCYVGSNREVISWIDGSLGLMPPEEQEMYLGLLKKSLSGTLGKNLIDIEFSTQQVADSDEHRLLQTLRQTGLQDRASRETLCREIMNSLDLGDSSYLILLAADSYDVPYRGRDDEVQEDASDGVFRYFVCSICPVKAPALALRYILEENTFHSSSTGNIVSAPALGFLFPAFDNRAANIYNALYYCKNPAELHQEVIDAVFRIQEPPMSAVEQKNLFDTTLAETLDRDCSYDVVQAVHEQIRARMEDHKERKDPEPLTLSVNEVGGILAESGVPEERVEAFRTACGQRYGEDALLNPGNIIDSKHFEVTTPEVKITIAPENSYLIETRIINGRRYLLIPADEGVEVNGIGVRIPKEKAQDAEESE